MDRRTVLKGIGTAATSVATAVAAPLAVVAAAETAAAPAIARGLPDVTVVGAGAFGAWTALCLRERGAKVLLLDSYGAGNALQTSGDETRQNPRRLLRHGNLQSLGHPRVHALA